MTSKAFSADGSGTRRVIGFWLRTSTTSSWSISIRPIAALEFLRWSRKCFRELAAAQPGRRRFRVKPLDPGIKAPYRALSLSQLYDQIKAEEVRP